MLILPILTTRNIISMKRSADESKDCTLGICIANF